MGRTGDRDGFLRRCVVAAAVGLALTAFSVTVLAGPAESATGSAHAAKKSCKKGKGKAKKKCRKKKAPVPVAPGPVVTPPGIPDADGDAVPDATDNCPMVANTAQTNTDGDGQGDACDVCPNDANTTVCTVYDPGDMDGDLVPNAMDNCPGQANPGQADSDTDGKGDACDACPSESNPGSQVCLPHLSSIDLGDGPVCVGQTAFGTVTLTGPAQGDTNVMLQSSSSAASVPGTMAVQNGQTSGTFQYTAVSEADVTITATLGADPPAQDQVSILSATACGP
jgi:hypothetical protein